MGMTIEEAKKLDHFLCSDCVAEDDPKKGGSTFSSSPMDVRKVIFFFHLQVRCIHLMFGALYTFFTLYISMLIAEIKQ